MQGHERLAGLGHWRVYLALTSTQELCKPGCYGHQLAAAVLEHAGPEMTRCIRKLLLMNCAWHTGRLEGFAGVTEGLRHELERLKGHPPAESLASFSDRFEGFLRLLDYRLESAVDDLAHPSSYEVDLDIAQLWETAAPDGVKGELSLEPASPDPFPSIPAMTAGRTWRSGRARVGLFIRASAYPEIG